MQLVPKTNLSPEPTPTTEKIILDVGGMKCGGCVKAVERQLFQYPGVKSASVNLATEIAVVELETSVVDADALAQQLTAAGFPSQPRQASGKVADKNQGKSDPAERQRREIQSARRQLIIAALLLLLSGIGHFGNSGGFVLPVLHNIWFHCGLATIALLIPGRSILIDGWVSWRRLAPNMNTLVGLGTLIAYTASLVALLFPQLGWECFFDEPVMMLGFILLGRTLEKQARGRVTAAFKNLLDLQPQLARLIPKRSVETRDGASLQPSLTEVIEIPAEQVRVGEWLQVLPGDKIPVDGVVIDGQTTIDESMLTGEAVPVLKQRGDTVTAGTLNQSGAIAIEATRTGNDTTLAQIVALVEAAQIRKAPVQKLADTVAGYFTYGVLAAAVLTFLFWYFIGTHVWHDVTIWAGMNMAHHYYGVPIPTHHSPLLVSLKLAIAVMVVACPCALGLATPTAILVGTAIAAERGLLIKGGDVLEKVHQLDTIVFDKTGTLTSGNPTVTDCVVLEGQAKGGDMENNFDRFSASPPDHQSPIPNPQYLLQLAAAVERGTCHPLATAIQNQAQQQQLTILPATDFHTEPGLGVSAVVEGNLVLLGNCDWLSWHGIVIDDNVHKQVQKLAEDGKTVVLMAIAGTVAGLIAIQDTLRPDAKAAVDKLRHMGLRVMLLSGDTSTAAFAIANQLGLDTADVMAAVPPAKKAEVIQSLQNREIETSADPKSVVAMVGDGINDAPALSQADIGIALHTATDVAIETADIVLMRNCLSDVVTSIQLSRATFNKIRQNLFWAFAYNTLGIPLAAGILLPSLHFVLSPAGAAALMAFSSVSVVTNSLMLRRFSRS
ncbi:heavy metal translocating P-type ATPase [Fischerella thermalis]|uniref:heavy metal translocating P-type ATPase n=1 Tax=Fischerella thermalis TaxID=372787 RepID=UPI000C80CDC2|nr:heavy metal translocating P-type ATPase [Fischerella thermalis]PMB09058.1 heavy metal translocating P-type ATPase [Fischerella thermalis CCMEE 5328]MBF1991307.1 copper-translocating P-type ATPase [Fischerella thermalis M58_A2018_009]MBF2061372.1 copper-translocating P-type ATPase [Fischerella thermalis M66_A2018_004]MBF2070600.1 copper-translocating P-type ATPase [Fischerella thermalis M48_A2018_028]PLZ05333.1 heavy metal translocating P-type ATPase [Fischerella thermalis WC114]